MTNLSYFCQKCGLGNALGAELCERCGTRLLLIVEPPSARYEINYATPYEEHLLERISLLETYLSRMTDRFDKILELMMRQAQTLYLDHTLLETLIIMLEGSGVVESREVSKLWNLRRTVDSSKSEANARSLLLRKSILDNHKTTEKKEFAQRIESGLALLEEGKTKSGIKLLEKALALSPANGPLLFLLGQHFYFANKPVLAGDYLAQSLIHEPSNGLACLLLGLLCGDAGETAHAKTLLQIGNRFLGVNFPAHYALGRIHAAEGNWTSALTCFKKALAANNESEEAQFAVGCAYYALKRFKLSRRFLHKAVRNNEKYAEAWYRLGLIACRSGDNQAAHNCFLAAIAAEKENVVYNKLTKLPKDAILTLAETPIFGVTSRTKKLISGGDKRLAAFLLNEVECLCKSYPLTNDYSAPELAHFGDVGN